MCSGWCLCQTVLWCSLRRRLQYDAWCFCIRDHIRANLFIIPQVVRGSLCWRRGVRDGGRRGCSSRRSRAQRPQLALRLPKQAACIAQCSRPRWPTAHHRRKAGRSCAVQTSLFVAMLACAFLVVQICHVKWRCRASCARVSLDRWCQRIFNRCRGSCHRGAVCRRLSLRGRGELTLVTRHAQRHLFPHFVSHALLEIAVLSLLAKPL